MYWIFVILLIMLGGFRYKLGIDSIRYEDMQLTQPTLASLSKNDLDESRFGMGWMFFASFAKSLNASFVCLTLLHAIYINSIFGWFIKKYSKHCFLSLLIYFIFLYSDFQFEILRESSAVATFLLSWKYLLKRKWIGYYIFCFGAFLFHVSAIVTFLVPLAVLPHIKNYFKINKRFVVMLFVIIGASITINVIFFQFLAEVAFIDSVQERASTYVNHTNLSGQRQASIVGYLGIFINRIIYPLAVYFFIYKFIKKTKAENGYSLSFTKMIAFYLIFSAFSVGIVLCSRFTNYFFPFTMLLIADSAFTRLKLNKTTYKMKYCYWMLFLLPFFFIQSYAYFKEDGDSGVKRYHRYYPYSSVFMKISDSQRNKLQNYYIDWNE